MAARRQPTFGRAQDFARVLALLSDPAAPLVTLTGRAGVGKTHLALDIVAALSPLAAVVSLASIDDPTLVMAATATALGVPALPETDPFDTVARHIGNDDVFVVLDNFEHVLDAATEIAELIEQCPNLRVLVTSQSPLHLRNERVFGVAPLPVPVDESIEALADQPSVALYCERARAVHCSFELGRENANAIAELCRALEGLPLAIELAAARAATLPAADVLTRLADAPLDTLRRPRQDAPPRHRDLRGAIAWTYELLGEIEQRTFRHLSVIAGSFGVQAVEAMSDGIETSDAVDAVSALVDVHLVDPVAGAHPVRYLMASSIRAFADEQLRARSERDFARVRHVSWRGARSRELTRRIDEGAESTTLVELNAAKDDYVHSLHEALDLDMIDDALDIATLLAPFCEYRGFHPAYEHMLDDVLVRADKDAIVSAAHADTLTWSAQLGLRMRVAPDRELMIERLGRGDAMARAVGDETAILRSLACRMVTMPMTGDVKGAISAGEEATERARAFRSERWLARFEVWCGALAHQMRQDDDAIDSARRGLVRARRIGDPRTVLVGTMVLQPMIINHPELAAELPTREQTLVMARELGLAVYEAGILSSLTVEAVSRGELDAAAGWCGDALRFVRGSSVSPLMGYALASAATVAAAYGNVELAAYLHGVVRSARRTLQTNSAHEHVTANNEALARVRNSLGDESFEAIVARGAGVPWTDALEEALVYVRTIEPPRVETSPAPEEPSPHLTPRQLEVLQLLARGLRNKEIATTLDLTPKTVTHHLSAVYQQLGVRGRSEATAWAFRAGIAT
jgi:predicted ATPase/DNA-binding CsgD family transcriptional regulator